MAEAVQELFPGTQIAFGPATDDGYFYDFVLPENISSDDFGAIEKKMAQIVKRRALRSRGRNHRRGEEDLR